MIKGTEIYCDYEKCESKLIVAGQKLKAQKKPGAEGKVLWDFLHFHAREPQDCYYKYLRDRIVAHPVLTHQVH